jgi:hypothetical protein
MRVELRIPRDRALTRVKYSAALLFTFSLTLWAAVPASAQVLSQGKGNLRVMTYNVYEGADLSVAFSAQTQMEFLTDVGAILASVQATNPPARAEAIAARIGKAQPTLVSLQEVTEWKTCPANSTLTDCLAPPTVLYDLLNLVKDALQTQGYSYKEVARVDVNELIAPAITTTGAVIAFYTQRSAILARADISAGQLRFSNVQSSKFDANLTIPTVLGPFTVNRAWLSADVKYHDASFRFIDTQLESFDPNINYQQGQELLSGPANTPKPVIIAMDSNSKANPPENPFSPTYFNLLFNGFMDAWTEALGDAPGPTCCQDPSLLNPGSIVTDRVDLILLRGNLNAEAIQLFGGQTSDKTAGLWPSDHVGVAARLETD